jgi:hypothetical protein
VTISSKISTMPCRSHSVAQGLQKPGAGGMMPLQRLDDDAGDLAPCSASSERTKSGR